MLALTDATNAYEAKLRELDVAYDKFDQMQQQEDATRAEEAKEMEAKRKADYDTRFDAMETKRKAYEDSKARQADLDKWVKEIDDRIQKEEYEDEDELKGLQYDKKQWEAELLELTDDNLDALEEEYKEQKKDFDSKEKEAKAAAKKKVDDEISGGF